MKINIRNNIKKRFPAIIALVVLSLQGIASPADSYYKDNMAGKPALSELPSQTHYNKNLRAGGDEWEEDENGNPNGEGEGSNTGVAVPVGEAGLSITVCLLAYGIFAYTRKKR